MPEKVGILLNLSKQVVLKLLKPVYAIKRATKL